ncbi:MAG: hypothetical protein M3Q44_08295 [bacterium]|nr:hypothetical protein [bacterium]
MKSKTISIVVLAIVLIGVGFMFVTRERPLSEAPKTSVTSSDTNTKKWETKIDTQASVTVAVTPLDLSPQSIEWKFSIVMDTHSVELDNDMTKVVILVDGQGKEYKPLNWDGSVGGHHRDGVLTFSQITPTPKSVELKIVGVGDIVRSFSWQF